MSDRAVSSLTAAERVRQIAIDEAKRVLSDAIYVCNAARRKLAGLETQAASAQAYASALHQAHGMLDVAAIRAAAAYGSWHRAEVDSARRALALEEQAEAEARTALAACLRARDAICRLQDRRRLHERQRSARHAQHAIDDLGAIRALASRSATIFPSGDQHGS
jgi:flagellar biosynthesis chaperone FliJ